MNSLPEMHADAVRLRFFGGLQFDAIAQAMGCSLRTAKYRVKEGLLRLGHVLAKRSDFEVPASDSPTSEDPKSEVHHALR
jgi:DNA-directed RNA polymerase specialized sigma24 family protein